MKKEFTPREYRLVAFRTCRTTTCFVSVPPFPTKETIEVNGETYPVYKMEISNSRTRSIRAR